MYLQVTGTEEPVMYRKGGSLCSKGRPPIFELVLSATTRVQLDQVHLLVISLHHSYLRLKSGDMIGVIVEFCLMSGLKDVGTLAITHGEPKEGSLG